jgi:hypothetical protein
MRQHFGLGDATEVDDVAVRWPDGKVTHAAHVKGDRIVTIDQRSDAGGRM